MVLVIIIVVIVVAVVIALIVTRDDYKKFGLNAAELNAKLQEIKNFTPSSEVYSPKCDFLFAVDDAQERVVIITKDSTRSFAYNDILSVELLESGNVVSRKSTKGIIGRAIVGGVLAGGAGTIVGGLSAKNTERRKVSSIVVKITLRDVVDPVLNLIIFENYKLPPYSDEECMALFYAPANKIHDILCVIIDKVNQKEKVLSEKKKVEEDSKSLADEIKKLHQLLQDNVITEAEFSKMKEKLIK